MHSHRNLYSDYAAEQVLNPCKGQHVSAGIRVGLVNRKQGSEASSALFYQDCVNLQFLYLLPTQRNNQSKQLALPPKEHLPLANEPLAFEGGRGGGHPTATCRYAGLYSLPKLRGSTCH